MLLNMVIFPTLLLLLLQTALATPVQPHKSGGAEHIVIINKNHPIPPRVEDILDRLALHDKHPDVRHVFNNSAFQGFAANMHSHCLDQLANMTDEISLVEPAAEMMRTYEMRAGAPWGLQRISTAARVISGNDKSFDFTYAFANENLGTGADIYIIDTGIYTANAVFGGRAHMIWSLDGHMTDDDGHGTHVAGTAAGNVIGVASNANIFGLKALDPVGGGDGWTSNVVGAIDAVMRHHDHRKSHHPSFRGSVMSMSLATAAPSTSIDQAIRAATAAGLHAVVAAGNDGENACSTSPASTGGENGPAITVGAVEISGRRADFSNHGPCVDLYAPGVSIISAWTGSPYMVNSLSGTSMAAPHVTGIVAYAMANATLARSPALMKEWVGATALDMSDDAEGTLLANNGVRAVEGNLGVWSKVGVVRPAFEDAAVERAIPKRREWVMRKKQQQKQQGCARRIQERAVGLASSLGKMFSRIVG